MIAHAMARARGGCWLPQELQARRANLRRGRAALGQQVGPLTDAYLAGVVPLAEYERRRRDTEARLQALVCKNSSSRVMPNARARRLTWQPTLRRSVAVCARAWQVPTSIRSGRCSNCWLSAWSSLMALSRSATSSRLGPTASASHFADCVLTIETATSRLKRLGERLRARDPARQVAELQIRCANLNTFSRLGLIKAEKGSAHLQADFCNKAVET